jgi:hypothetical protein
MVRNDDPIVRAHFGIFREEASTDQNRSGLLTSF